MNKTLTPLLLGGIIAMAAGSAAADSITLYEGANYGGRNITADRPISNFSGTDFNDRAQSAVVHDGRWEICIDAAFSGGCSVLTPGAYPSLGAYGSRISSLRPIEARPVGGRTDARDQYHGSRAAEGRAMPDARATLYSRRNLSGRSFPVADMTPDLDRTRFNDRAASLRVESGYWIFCSEAEFRGECRTFGPGDYASLPGMNETISSGRLISAYYPYADRPDWLRDSALQSQNEPFRR